MTRSFLSSAAVPFLIAAVLLATATAATADDDCPDTHYSCGKNSCCSK